MTKPGSLLKGQIPVLGRQRSAVGAPSSRPKRASRAAALRARSARVGCVEAAEPPNPLARAARPTQDDLDCLAGQLGRPRAADLHPVWRVAARCPHGLPAAAEALPYDAAGRPFPTLFYLSCPTAVAAVRLVEASGGVRRYAALLAAARPRSARTLDAVSLRVAERYERRRRRTLAHGPAAAFLARAADGGASLSLGVGGVADRTALKCLHCHAAHALARPPYSLGQRVLDDAAAAAGGLWCGDARCRRFLSASPLAVHP